MSKETPILTHCEALYAAILAQPDEDTPRLMYADAIEERNRPGDAERAWLIRRQIAGESVSSLLVGGGSAKPPLAAILPEIYDNGMLMRSALTNGMTTHPSRPTIAWFVRGFMGRFFGLNSDWVNNATVLKKRYPIQKLALTGYRDYLYMLSASLDSRIRELQFLESEEWDGSDVQALASHSLARGFRRTIRAIHVRSITYRGKSQILHHLPCAALYVDGEYFPPHEQPDIYDERRY